MKNKTLQTRIGHKLWAIMLLLSSIVSINHSIYGAGIWKEGAWAIQYQIDGTDQWSNYTDRGGTLDLGSVSNLKLRGFKVKTYGSDAPNVKGSYNVNGYTGDNTVNSPSSDDGDNKEWTLSSEWTVNMVTCFSSSSGEHTASITFQISNWGGDCYSECKIKFTYTPPAPTGYSLGGYINGADKNSYDANADFAFVNQSGNVWTLTRSFQNADNYFQVYDNNGECYGVSSYTTNNPATLVKNTCNEKVGATGLAAETNYTITWNSSTKQISWAQACTAPTAQSVYIGDGSSISKTICFTGNTFVRLAASQNGYSYQLKRQNGDSWDDVGDAWSSTGIGSHDFTDLNTAGIYKITGYPNSSTPSSCNADMSNTVTLNVDAESVAGNITGDGSICSGESKSLGVSGNTGTVTQWKSSATSDGTYSDIIGATTSTYSASPASTTYYKVVVKNGVCDAVTSSSYATVTVNPAATAAEYPIKSGTDTKSYTGSRQGVTIEPVSGTGTTYTVYYTGTEGTSYTKSSNAPINVGKYSVTVDAQKGTSYCAANNLDVGTLTITAAAPNITMGAISNACGTGGYNISGLASSNSDGSITYSIVSGGTGTATISGNTLNVTATGTVNIRASQAASGNYSAGSQDETYTFASAPVAGFSASAESSTLNFSNIAYVSTTLSTDANSNWDFQWVCDSHPTWGSNNTPTIVSTTSNSTEVRFPIEGVYTFHVGAKCKKDGSYVNSTTVTVTVSLPLCIKGPLTSSTGSWNSFTSLSNISNSNTRTYGFTAYNLGTNIREFVLDASASGDDKHHIHTASTVGSLTLTGLDYNSSNDYNLRALEALGISSLGTPVLLTITHNGGLSYNISLVLNCTTPDTKDISISESSVCQGESVNVVVESSQDGYIYTVYDSNSSTAGSGIGTGSDLNISVTPSAGTTYTVKAKQADACLETSMANTVDISVNERPSFTPSTGITQYAPVTVTSTALSPSWSIASKDPDVDAAWISTTSGSSTVLKAPTGTYTVSDGGPCPTNAIVVSNDTEICN